MDALNDDLTRHFSSLGPSAEGAIRLLIATLLGALVGIERELRGRQAGFRTNMLVALGSALVMLVSIHFANISWPLQSGLNTTVDPGRIAYGVMTGIGFLGAGAIIKNGSSVRGLTTAAGLWCVAAIGLAAGLGMYVLAAAATVIVLIALWLLGYIENALPKRRYRRVVVRCPWSATCTRDLAHRVESVRGVEVKEHGFTRNGELDTVDVDLSVSFTRHSRLVEVQERLAEDVSCRIISITRL